MEEECHLTPETALVGSETPRVPPSRNRHRPQYSGNTGLGWALSTRDASSQQGCGWTGQQAQWAFKASRAQEIGRAHV